MKKKMFQTVLNEKNVRFVRVEGSEELKPESIGFRMDILDSKGENTGNIAYNEGGFLYININTRISPDVVIDIINKMAEGIEIEAQ